MQFLLLQTFVWMLLAGVLGAILGCMAHRFFAGRALEDGVAVHAGSAAAKPAVVSPPVAARVVPKAPMVEASKAPAPIAPAAPATAPDRAPGGYTYPITTVGIPRANPELVQPQIQSINLPSAAGAAVAAGAGAVAAAVTIRQPAAPSQAGSDSYPITTIGIPKGHTELPAAAAKATVSGDATRFERALTGEQAQPRPEPLRPELGRSAPVAAPVAPVVKAPVPIAPSAAATVAPVAPAAPVTAPPVTAAPVKPVAPPVAATVAPAAPAPVAKVPNAPIASKPAGIAAGSPAVGPIASKPAGIPAPHSTTTPAPVAAKPAAAADVPFEPVVAGGAALAAIAARAASAQAAAAAAANAATSAPVTPAAAAPVAPAPVAAKPAAVPAVAASQVATGGDDFLRIRAIDSAMQARLKAAGVTRFSEMARWMPGDVSRISQSLGVTGRIEQENWIEQAQILATGGETDYSRRRLRGEIPTAAAGASVAPAATQVATKPAAGGSDTSVAAATAAAAAMASAAIARATANIEPAMPSKLVDAIRENLAKPAATAAAAAAPVVAAVTAAVAPMAPAADAGRVSRPDLAGLRSVRSEALRDTAHAGGGARQGGAIEDLKRIRGIGVLIEKKLNSLGVTGYEQIANWSNADIDRVSQILDFKGRIERENWVEQARILASGGQTEFSKRVDRGEA